MYKINGNSITKIPNFHLHWSTPADIYKTINNFNVQKPFLLIA